MRKKSNQLFTLRGIVAAAIVGGMVLLSSCKEDEATQGYSDPTREVSFSAYAQKGARTRVAETTSSTITTFNVYAVWSGDPSKGLEKMAPAEVSGGPDDWTYMPKQLWPQNGTIDFYAYSPNVADNLTKNYTSTDCSDMSVNYVVPMPNRALPRQQDLLVAVKPGVSCYTPGPVSLNFQHALSCIRLKARPAVNGATYVVHGVKFLNLKNTGKLQLSTANIPDGDGFTYNDLIPRSTLVLWTGQSNPVDYAYSFDPAIAVDDPAEYTEIIAGDSTLMVLPQATELGDVIPITDYVDETAPADPDDAKFYVRIDFTSSDDQQAKRKVKYYAVREPLYPSLNLPLTFEIGRSYTFVVDLSGSEYINFMDVHVADFDEAFGKGLSTIDITTSEDPNPAAAQDYVPEAHKGFAGSFIYWDSVNERMTFEEVDYDPTKDPANAGLNPGDPGFVDKSQYQGLQFKWGSLVGISSRSANWGGTTVLYTPSSSNGSHVKTDAAAYAAGAWGGIAPGSTATLTAASLGISDIRLSGYATFLNADPDNLAAFRGDICAYLSGRDGVPKGYWRLPTSAEFDPGFPAPFVQADHYTRTTAFAGVVSDKDDGTFVIESGYTLISSPANKRPVFFPAGGFRNPTNGNIAEVGTHVSALASSPTGANGHYLYGIAASINPAQAVNRLHGFQVRCVKK